MRAKWFALVAAGALVFAFAPTSIAQEQMDKGSGLGTVIRSAIQTALPAAGALMDTIWKYVPHPNKSQSKSDIQTAVTKARTELMKAAEAKLQPVADDVSQIQTVNKYLEPTVIASQSTSIMLGILSSAEPLTDANWASVRTEWDIVKGELAHIGSVDVAPIRDLWLRDKLSRISKLTNVVVKRADGDLASKQKASLVTNLQTVQSTLGDVSAAVGYQLSDLQQNLDELSSWARGAQGGSDHKPAQLATYRNRLDKLPSVKE